MEVEPEKISTAKYRLRRKLVVAWVDDLAFLRDQMTGKMRRDLDDSHKYARDLGGLGIPIKGRDGGWGVVRWEAEYDTIFYFVPLLQVDTRLHPFFRHTIRSANYNEGPRAIFLPPYPMSRQWRAILLSHELCHTVAHNAKWHRRKKFGHWVEEYEIYRAEAYLVRKVYGRRYGDAVYRLSKKFEPGIRERRLPYPRVSDAQIDRIFGAPLSDYERRTQKGLFILDALYRATDRIFPSERRRDREGCMLTFWFCNPDGYRRYKSEKAKTPAPSQKAISGPTDGRRSSRIR